MQSTAWTLLCAAVTLAVLGEVHVWGRSVPHHRVQSQLHNSTHNYRHSHHAEKITQTNLHKTLDKSGRRPTRGRKKSVWKTLTDTLTQLVLGDDDDYDDSSSSSDSGSDSDSASSYSTKQPPQQSRWSVLNKKSSKNRLKNIFQITTFPPLQVEEINDKKVMTQADAESKKKLIEWKPAAEEGIAEVVEEEVAQGVEKEIAQDVAQGVEKEVGVALGDGAQQFYKMVSRGEELALLEREVTYSSRWLSFIEYALTNLLTGSGTEKKETEVAFLWRHQTSQWQISIDYNQVYSGGLGVAYHRSRRISSSNLPLPSPAFQSVILTSNLII